MAVSNYPTGLIESVEFEPRVLRTDAAELAGQVRAAVNGAMADLRASAAAGPGAAAYPGIDTAVLAKRLSEVQDQALRQLYQLTSALQDVVGQISRGADIHGSVAVPDVDELFAQARLSLAPQGRSLPPGPGQDEEAEQPRGEGAAGPGGLVRATAAPGGHIESLSIEAGAVRKGSQELAGYVRTAVNAALADLSSKQRTRIETAAAGRAELAERVRTVQDLSVRQMRAFGESLAELMASIAPRT